MMAGESVLPKDVVSVDFIKGVNKCNGSFRIALINQ